MIIFAHSSPSFARMIIQESLASSIVAHSGRDDSDSAYGMGCQVCSKPEMKVQKGCEQNLQDDERRGGSQGVCCPVNPKP